MRFVRMQFRIPDGSGNSEVGSNRISLGGMIFDTPGE